MSPKNVGFTRSDRIIAGMLHKYFVGEAVCKWRNLCFGLPNSFLPYYFPIDILRALFSKLMCATCIVHLIHRGLGALMFGAEHTIRSTLVPLYPSQHPVVKHLHLWWLLLGLVHTTQLLINKCNGHWFIYLRLSLGEPDTCQFRP